MSTDETVDSVENIMLFVLLSWLLGERKQRPPVQNTVLLRLTSRDFLKKSSKIMDWRPR